MFLSIRIQKKITVIENVLISVIHFNLLAEWNNIIEFEVDGI